jgi:hypothetical protein
MIPFPEEPVVPAEEISTASVSLRYEDVVQDGRLALEALSTALAPAWNTLLTRSQPVRRGFASGVVPILTRLVLDGGPGPIGIVAPIEVTSRYRLAHTVDAAGAVDRLLLNIWGRATGRRDRTNAPPPDRAGAPADVGRIFAAHVFTRPFAPPEHRRVAQLDLPEGPGVPPHRDAWVPLDASAALPTGAVALDDAWVIDPAPIAFGLAHTDSNQHVNSLAYPRLFEDAALRRFAAHGRPTAVLARRLEAGFRKPCFAGEVVRVAVRAFELDGRLGAVGVFVPTAAVVGGVLAPDARPHCYLTTLFEGATGA